MASSLSPRAVASLVACSATRSQWCSVTGSLASIALASAMRTSRVFSRRVSAEASRWFDRTRARSSAGSNLGDEVAGARVQPRHLVLETAAGGDQDDRQQCGRGLCPQPARDLQAVHLRHPDVEEGDIRRLAQDLRQRIGPVIDVSDSVAGPLEHDAQQRASRGVVFGNNDRRRIGDRIHVQMGHTVPPGANVHTLEGHVSGTYGLRPTPRRPRTAPTARGRPAGRPSLEGGI